jgi:hypothetical protein
MESKSLMEKQSIITDLRNIRVERILEAKQSRVLTSPWMRRTLSLVAIISSYAVLATLLIPTPYTISKTNRIYADYEAMKDNWLYDFRDLTQGFALLFLVWSYILLRMSMRRVTLLPNEYLDELQITNRDWAFKTGYLVVRRIGLAVALLFAFLATVGNQLTGFSAGYGRIPSAFKALERLLSGLSTEDPFGFYFKVFLLLAFVAYSFPLILLAWREARFPEVVPEAQDIQEAKVLSDQARKAKFYFTALKWILIFFAVSASIGISPKVFMTLGQFYYLLLVPLVYWVIPGSVVLFIWASIASSKSVIVARKAGFASDQQRRFANLTTLFLTITLSLGFAVGYLMVFSITNMWRNFGPEYAFILPVAMICGVLMIPAQAISMAFFAKLDNK